MGSGGERLSYNLKFAILDLQFSATDGETVSEAVGQTGLADFSLCRFEVVLDPPLFDHLAIGVQDAIGGAPVAIARLSDAAGVDEIFFPRSQADLTDGDAADIIIRTKAVGQWVWPKKQSVVCW